MSRVQAARRLGPPGSNDRVEEGSGGGRGSCRELAAGSRGGGGTGVARNDRAVRGRSASAGRRRPDGRAGAVEVEGCGVAPPAGAPPAGKARAVSAGCAATVRRRWNFVPMMDPTCWIAWRERARTSERACVGEIPHAAKVARVLRYTDPVTPRMMTAILRPSRVREPSSV